MHGYRNSVPLGGIFALDARTEIPRSKTTFPKRKHPLDRTSSNGDPHPKAINLAVYSSGETRMPVLAPANLPGAQHPPIDPALLDALHEEPWTSQDLRERRAKSGHTSSVDIYINENERRRPTTGSVRSIEMGQAMDPSNLEEAEGGDSSTNAQTGSPVQDARFRRRNTGPSIDMARDTESNAG